MIYDPVLNQYHQIGVIHELILKKLDGRRSLHDVIEELLAEFNAELPMDVLGAFLAQARTLHLLDAGSTAPFTPREGRTAWKLVKRELDAKGFSFRTEASPRRGGEAERRVRADVWQLFELAIAQLKRGNPIQAARHLYAVLEVAPDNARAAYLLRVVQRCALLARKPPQPIWMFRIPLSNPDRLLAALVARLGFLVSPWVYAGLILWFLAGAVLIGQHLDKVGYDVGQIPRAVARWPMLALGAYLWFPLVAIGHELCHGLACKKYGGRVPEIGLLVFLFFPTAYCDTSATYGFRQVSRRIGVSLAGISWQMFLYLPAVLAYLNLPASSPLKPLMLLLVLTCWGTVISGMIPFFKGDGYYVLTDALRTPNLFEISNRYWGERLAGWVLGLAPTGAAVLDRPWVVRTYGLLNIGTIALFTASAYFTVSVPLMTTLFRGPGLLIATAPMLAVLGVPLVRFLRTVIQRRTEVVRSPRAWATLAVMVSVALFAVLVPLPYSVTVPFEVAESETMLLRASASGQVKRWSVREGDAVRAGEILVELDAAEPRLALARAEAGLERARAELTAVERRPQADRVQALRAVIEAVRRIETSAERRLERDTGLLGQGLVSTQGVEASAALVERARDLAVRTRGDLDAAFERPREEQLEALRQGVTALEAEVELRRKAVEALVVRAPRDGRVVWSAVARTEVSPEGSSIARGSALLRLGESSAVAELDAPVEYAQLFQVGQGVRMRLEGVGGPPVSTALAATEVAHLTAKTTQSPMRGMIVKGFFGSRALADRDIVRIETERLSGQALMPGARGRARIEIGPRTLLWQAGWQVRYFAGYYWWSLW